MFLSLYRIDKNVNILRALSLSSGSIWRMMYSIRCILFPPSWLVFLSLPVLNIGKVSSHRIQVVFLMTKVGTFGIKGLRRR